MLCLHTIRDQDYVTHCLFKKNNAPCDCKHTRPCSRHAESIYTTAPQDTLQACWWSNSLHIRISQDAKPARVAGPRSRSVCMWCPLCHVVHAHPAYLFIGTNALLAETIGMGAHIIACSARLDSDSFSTSGICLAQDLHGLRRIRLPLRVCATPIFKSDKLRRNPIRMQWSSRRWGRSWWWPVKPCHGSC